ncbi:unnamed protein product [Gulo gulo]|uniref:Uncharacterized protein n=1 Tax=Gulo gulo TaxID=48420 RepID=A0A9X9Q675_GULGU|nr:unnamed protein product [Gulo gulo]
MLPRAGEDAGMPLPSTDRSPGGSSPPRQSGGSSPPRQSPLVLNHWACGCLCFVFSLSVL